jgi:hypothetical protein
MRVTQPAHANMIDAIREAADAHHPGWDAVTVTFRDDEGRVLGFGLIRPDEETWLTSAEIVRSRLCGLPTR